MARASFFSIKFGKLPKETSFFDEIRQNLFVVIFAMHNPSNSLQSTYPLHSQSQLLSPLKSWSQ